MAEEFIELGIEGVDKMVDKHFHKLPDKYMDPHTYSLRGRHKNRYDDKEDESDEGSSRGTKEHGVRESAVGDDDGRRRYSPEPRESYAYNTPQRQRIHSPQDQSAYSRDGYDYVAPPSSSGTRYDDNRGRGRPDGLVRRSSSQPGNFRDNGRTTARDDKDRERRRGKSFSEDRRRDRPDSGAGNRNSLGLDKTEKVMLTVLGAAVGGLAASAVLDSMGKKNERKDDMRVGGRARTGGSGRDGGGQTRHGKGGGRR